MSLITAGAESQQTQPDDAAILVGHPRALMHLLVSEAFERFAYFGVQSHLALYLVNRLLTPEPLKGVWGLGVLVSALGGDATPQKLASALFGVYGGLVYLAPVLGGLLADKLLGPIRTVRCAGGLAVIGCFLIASETLFLPGLVCVAIGAGGFKSNIASQVSSLYQPQDGRRGAAFQLLFISINLGVIAAPLVCGWISLNWGWSWGFAAAGAGMLAGLAVYVSGERSLPKVRRDIVAAPGEAVGRLRGARAWGMASLAAAFTVILVGNHQIYNAYLVWAEQSARLDFGGFSVPVAWLVSFDTVCSLLVMAVGLRMGRWGPAALLGANELGRIAFGAAVVAASYCALAGASLATPASQRAGFGWLAAFHLLNGIGFAYVLPTGLALFARLAPLGLAASALGAFYLTYAASNLVTGALGGLLAEMSGVAFWGLHAALIAAAAAALALARPLLARALA